MTVAQGSVIKGFLPGFFLCRLLTCTGSNNTLIIKVFVVFCVDVVQVKPEQFHSGCTLLDKSQASLVSKDEPDFCFVGVTSNVRPPTCWCVCGIFTHRKQNFSLVLVLKKLRTAYFIACKTVALQL